MRRRAAEQYAEASVQFERARAMLADNEVRRRRLRDLEYAHAGDDLHRRPRQTTFPPG
jgi:hypothetical protein